MLPTARIFIAVFVFALILGVAPVQAQFLHVEGTFPGQSAINIPSSAVVEITFDAPVSQPSINSNSFVVQGNMTGYHPGIYLFADADQLVLFLPIAPFAKGEVVTVTLTAAITGLGFPTPYLAHPYVFTFTVETGPGLGSVLETADYPIGFTPLSICAADYNNDNAIDIAVSGAVENLLILTNTGDGTFIPTGTFPMGSYPLSLISFNINRDGFLDLAASNWYNDSIVIMEGVGGGDFLYHSSKFVGATPSSVCASDFNGSGYLDMAVSNWQSYDVYVMFNLSGDALGPPSIYDTDPNPRWVYASDVDNDWDMDIVVAQQGSNSVGVLYNTGTGSFVLGSSYPAGTQPIAVVAANLDNFGYPDFAAVNFIDNSVTIIFRDSIGFVTQTLAVGAAPRSIVATDIGGDGDLDLVVSNQDDSTVSILLNSHEEGFAPQQVFSTGAGPYAGCAADFDGDSDIDLATANFFSQDVTVLQPKPMVVIMYMQPSNLVNMLIIDPVGRRLGFDEFGIFYNEIPDGYYIEKFDPPTDSAVIPEPLEGEFIIQFYQQAFAKMITYYSAIIKTDGTLEAVIADNETAEKQALYEYFYRVEEGYHYKNGDANRDETVNVADAVFIINYVFKGGPASYPIYASDANCDKDVNVSDAVYLINYVFKGGNKPCCCVLCGDICL